MLLCTVLQQLLPEDKLIRRPDVRMASTPVCCVCCCASRRVADSSLCGVSELEQDASGEARRELGAHLEWVRKNSYFFETRLRSKTPETPEAVESLLLTVLSADWGR